MARVLIASSSDWLSAGRLVSMLGHSGVELHVVGPSDTLAGSSSLLSGRTVVSGGVGDIARAVVGFAESFDRMVVCDEPLIAAVLEETGDRPHGHVMLTPGPALLTLMDKTRFPAAAAAGGLPVLPWRVAESLDRVEEAAAALGGAVVIKARSGYGGMGVRLADTPASARRAASRVGLPVLVEQQANGALGLMPCLYDRGRLVAVTAAHKTRLVKERGPSAVVEHWAVDDALAAIAKTAGRVFALDGFASIDVFRDAESGSVHVIEINPRPVLAFYLGPRVGVDFASAYSAVLDGTFDGRVRYGRSSGSIPLFPQELRRLRRLKGRFAGTVAWMVAPGALAGVPWGDLGALRYYLGKAR